MAVLLVAVTGSKNFGDEAMFISIYKALERRRFNVDVLTPNVEQSMMRFKNIKFIPIPRFSKWAVRKSLYLNVDLPLSDMFDKYEALYVSGGGNLNSFYSSHVAFLSSIVSLFKRVGKYVEFRPQSIGPFMGNLGFLVRKKVIKIAKRADRFYVRERESAKLLNKYGVTFNEAFDDAWNLSPETVNIDIPGKKLVGLCIRPWKIKESYLRIYFSKLIELFDKNGVTPFFIPIAYGGRSEYIDNIFLKKSLAGTRAVFLEDLVDVEKMTPANIKWLIGRCNVCLGLSYHFNVFALSQNIPSIGLYYEDYYKIKNKGLYEMLGIQDRVLNPIETNVDELFRCLMHCLDRK